MTNKPELGLSRKAQTVLGLIDSKELGVTLPHEHFLIDTRFYFEEPTTPGEKELAYQSVNLENLNWCIQHPKNNLDAYLWDDEQLTIKELMLFKEAGGSTIVEATPHGCGRDPLALVRISRATGVNVIMTTGYYVAVSHPPSIEKMSEEEIAGELVRDITVGVGDTGIRAGFLKAACGNSPRIEENERKVMRACAIAQKRTGALMGVHNTRAAFVEEVIEILGDAGADLSRTILIHSGYLAPVKKLCSKMLQTGCYIEFDRFGSERGFIPAPGDPYPQNDCATCDMILQLIDQGYLERILLSQDVFMKQDHVSFGGKGYAHILTSTVPLMRHKGITDKQIYTMMVENPQRAFSFT